MATQFSLKTFLRQGPMFLVMQYFQEKELLLDFPWARERDTDRLAEAIFTLGEPGRAAIQDFSDIYAMATKAGIQQIIKEARGPMFNLELAADFKQMSVLEGAMWVFMNHYQLFHWASETLSLDKLTSFSHCLAGKNLYCSDDEETRNNLAEGISEFFSLQGRGERSAIDFYLRGNPIRYCFFAYSEDYKVEDLVFDDEGRLTVQAWRPVTEVIFVYHPDTGMLDVHARGSNVIKGMQDIFCRTVLGLPGIPDENTKVFDLSKIKDPDFEFNVDPVDGISDVSIKSIVAQSVKPKKTLTLDTETDRIFGDARQDISAAVEGMQIPYEDTSIRKLKLRVAFEPVGYGKPKTVTFSITEPNRCDLGDDPKHHVIKRYLEKWGFIRTLLENDN